MMIEMYIYIKKTNIALNDYASAYAGTLTNYTSTGTMKVKFQGTAIKLLFRTYTDRTSNASIIVDGVTYSGIDMKTPRNRCSDG